MFRFTTWRFTSTPKPLAALIRVVSQKRTLLKPDDIFKLCVTANGRDGKQLGLLDDKLFVAALRDAASEHVASFSPFQLNQVKEMCVNAGLQFEQVNSASPSTQQSQTSSTTSKHQQHQHQHQTVGEKLWDSTTAAVVPTEKSSTNQSTAVSSTSFQPPSAGSQDQQQVSQQQQQHKQPYQIDEATDPKALQDIMDVLFVAASTFDERNTYDLRKVQSVCNSSETASGATSSDFCSSSSSSSSSSVDLMTLLPWLTAKPLLHIIRTLAHINHQDYVLAQKLSRRICELAGTLTTTQCARVLGQLYRLKVQDSLTIIVRRIENDPNGLALHDLMYIVQAAHAQTHVSAALQPLVGRSLYELSGRVGEKDMSIHQLVQCIEVAAKYGQATNPHVKFVVEGAARRASEMSDRQLAATLQHAHAMNLISSEVFAKLHARAVALVPSDGGMDVRFLEPLLDVFSLLPFNSAAFMDGVLLRLSDDAGKLQVNNLVSVIELVASYPGAKGSIAVAALALAASMRKEVFDHQSLISVVLSLAQLGQLSDEFYELMEFLCGGGGAGGASAGDQLQHQQQQRKGFKQGSELVELLGFISSSSAAGGVWKTSADFASRFVPVFVRAAHDVIPSMSHQEVIEMQQHLRQLAIDDRGLNRRLISRLESLSVERAEAERAANLASMRRLNNPHPNQGNFADAEWDAVANQQQPQHQQSQNQRSVNYSGWGEAEVRHPQHSEQQKQQTRQQNQSSSQQQRTMSSREMAAMSKQKHQQQQRSSNHQPKQQKKPFDLKKAQWDMDI